LVEKANPAIDGDVLSTQAAAARFINGSEYPYSFLAAAARGGEWLRMDL
jgi:hypothetical protein